MTTGAVFWSINVTFGQELLGDLVYVELPDVGRQVGAGEEVAVKTRNPLAWKLSSKPRSNVASSSTISTVSLRMLLQLDCLIDSLPRRVS